MARKNLLKGFKKPKGITFEHLETNPDYGKFTAYPFEHGFGTTIGILSAEYCFHQFRVLLFHQFGLLHMMLMVYLM